MKVCTKWQHSTGNSRKRSLTEKTQRQGKYVSGKVWNPTALLSLIMMHCKKSYAQKLCKKKRLAITALSRFSYSI